MAGIPQVITEDRASGAQVVEGSLKFDDDKNLYLTRTGSSGNRKTWTWSSWVKKDTLGTFQPIFFGNQSGSGNTGTGLRFDDANKIDFYQYSGSSFTYRLLSNRVLRDVGWYHIVVAFDTTQSTAADRIKIYLNGEQVTSWASASYPNQNTDWYVNTTTAQYIGAYNFNDAVLSNKFDGTLSQCYLIDGQTLGPEYFGFTDPLTGIWRPKKFRAEGTTVNDGTNWSSSVSNAGNNPANLFDGGTSQYVEGDVNGTPVTWTGNVSGITKLEFYGVQAGSSRTFSVNGVDRLSLVPTSAGWFTVPDVTTLTAFSFSRGGSGNYVDLFAVRVDGVIMTDNTTQNLEFGNNGFYLPMDGKTLIGKDQSGSGNDWTPVNFGGSVTLDNPTVSGAIPILNTNDAGTVAKRGVRTDSKTYTVTASGGNYYLDGALKPTLNVLRGGSYTFDYTGATSHPFYLSSLQDGKHNSKAYSSRLYRSGGYLDLGTGHTDLQPGSGDFCIELYVNLVNQGANYPVFVDTRVSGGGDTNGFFWGIRDADNRIYLYTHSGTRIYADHSLTTGKWYHLALTRQSGTFRMFIDGRQVGVSYSQSQNYTNQIRYIGHSTNSEVQTWYIDAYISNFRFVKGEAVYTTNFTPPQTTLTTTSQGVSSSNVKLLCCQDSSPTTAVVSPGTITLGQAGSDAVTSVNTHNPFLYNSVHGNFGVNTATSNTTKISIPHYAADTLYYYCSAHSGMGSSINVTTDIRKADPYAWKCVLANSLVGSANDVSNQINSGTTEKVMTVSGATVNTAGNFYNSSYKFVAASSQEISTPGSSDFAFGTGDFCVECWYYNDTNGGGTTYNQLVGNIESSAEGFWRIGSVFGGNNKFWFTYTNGNYNDVSANININDGKWHHLAATREGGTLRLFVDGVVSATATVTQFFSQTTTLRMMYSAQQPGYANGYLQDVRVYKGAAKYTENFVIGSTAPDVLPDTPSGITGKANLTKITEGAVSFDGTGDYLDPPTSSDFGLASNDNFTIECFVFTSAGNQELIRQGTNNAGSDGMYFSIASSGELETRISGTTKTTTGKISFNSWNHISVCRLGGTLYMSINGVVESHGSVANSSTTGAFKIGSNFEESSFFTGHISNVRFVKGTALYTSDFTPPTEPLTEVTNTKLLCCQSPTSATAAAVVPPNEPFSGAGGAQGGGTTSDYLKVSSGGHSDFSVDGDFTFEWWHYRAAANANNGFMWTIGDSNTATGLELYWGTSGSALKLYTNGGPNSVTATAATGWHHYAVVRSGNTIKVYYDGTEGGSFTNTNTFSGDVRIGAEYYNGSVTGGMNGPMSQFRFVKGTAVYTSNFTAPTTALTAITNTKLLTLQGSTITDASGTNKTIEVFGTVTTDFISKNGDALATTFNPFTDDINTIRGQASGYATLNPLDVSPSVIANRGTTLSEGNLTSTVVSGADNKECVANISATSGKYYYEVMFNPGANNSDGAGWVADDGLGVDNSTAGGFMMIARDNGGTIIGCNGSRTNESAGTHPFDYYPGDVMGCAIDLDSRIATWYKNGQKHSFVVDFSSRTNLNGLEFKPLLLNRTAGSIFANFGQKPFKFPPPDGFQPLNLSNVQPEKVIARPDLYVGVSLWSGNGTSQNITGLKHKPDLVWIKKRAGGTARSHQLFDSVRGVYKTLHSDSTNGEDSNTNRLTAFNQDGFAVGGDDGANGSSGTFVGWTWKAGGNNGQFNIDDVGYANASDVNMNAGALNSSAYNQSQNWSALGTNDSSAPYNWEATFDGASASYGAIPPNGQAALVDFSGLSGGGISYSESVVVTYNRNSSAPDVTVNGSAIGATADGTDRTYTLSGSGTLTSVGTQTRTVAGAGDCGIKKIVVDGKELVDQGVTPAANVPSIAATGSSVGTKQGFSIVSYTGAGGSTESIPHGLEQSPDFVIIKNRDGGTSGSAGGWWSIYHDGFTHNHMYGFNDVSSSDSAWNNHGQITGTTSSVVQVANGDHSSANNWWTHSNGADYIMYSWHNIPGLQKFGTYVGNGNSDGPFIELGFKPAIFWMKAANATANWVIIDSKRPGYNPDQKTLCHNLSNAENASGATTNDILSNGFKVRGTTDRNSNGVTYIYCAWAEAPSMNLYGAQSNAR